MSVHVIYAPLGADRDPDDAEYARNVTISMLRRTWGNDPAKWPDEERAWLAQEGES